MCLLFLHTVYNLSCELEGSLRILCNLSALKFTFNICFRRRTLVAIGTHDLDTLHCPFTYEVGFVSSHSSYHIVLYIFLGFWILWYWIKRESVLNIWGQLVISFKVLIFCKEDGLDCKPTDLLLVIERWIGLQASPSSVCLMSLNKNLDLFVK